MNDAGTNSPFASCSVFFVVVVDTCVVLFFEKKKE